jgi:phosphoribosylanthranilate isomerase
LRGGTGETFDWTLLAARRSKVPLILSGGLSAENVAVAIAQTRPFAVDSASGTESSPGKKDEAKLKAFFEAVERTASVIEDASVTEGAAA